MTVPVDPAAAAKAARELAKNIKDYKKANPEPKKSGK